MRKTSQGRVSPEALHEFSALVAMIYDASFVPETWPAVLTRICEFADADRTTLILEDRAQPSRSFAYTSWDDPGWLETYVRDYMLINPMRLATEASVVPGDLVLTTDFMTTQEYQRTRIYKEFLRPRGLVDIAAAILEKTASTITVLSLKRGVGQGFADEVLRQKTKLLAPHVRRSAAMGRIFEGHRAEAAMLSQALDTLEAGIWLLDASSRVIHRNDSARALIGQGDAVGEVGGRIHLFDSAARDDFAAAMSAAVQGASSMDTRGAAIPIKAWDDRNLIGLVMPLTDGARLQACRGSGAAALFCIQEMRFPIPHAASTIVRMSGLTRREATVLLGVVELGGVPETAKALGLSEGTVKGYLKSVFRKTGTTRQSDLIKLVASARLPFLDRPLDDKAGSRVRPVDS